MVARLCPPSFSGMVLLPSCSIRPEEPEGCLLKVENNRGWRTQASLFSFCGNSGHQVTVVLGGAGGTFCSSPLVHTSSPTVRMAAGLVDQEDWGPREFSPSSSLLCPPLVIELLHVRVSTFQLHLGIAPLYHPLYSAPSQARLGLYRCQSHGCRHCCPR